MELWYPKGSSFELTAFLDADHARCIDSRKSTSEGIQFLGDKLVSWMSKKQNCTAMSSAEAEYVALSATCAQVMWMRTQLQDYGFNYNKIPFFEYGVTPTVFLAKVRGGTCTTAMSDEPDATGILTIEKLGIGTSGQVSSLIGAPLAALLSPPFKFLISSPVGVATVIAGMYCMRRYATDIGVRTDVIKYHKEEEEDGIVIE
nr:hypothetical protein [Tanacetum cinerariifolium]